MVMPRSFGRVEGGRRGCTRGLLSTAQTQQSAPVCVQEERGIARKAGDSHEPSSKWGVESDGQQECEDQQDDVAVISSCPGPLWEL